MFEEVFRGIKRHDKVTFLMYCGRSSKGPVYREVTATVNPLLLFSTHVVVNHGPCGQVVDGSNYVSHESPWAKRGRGKA